jgi:hypothetical protein
MEDHDVPRVHALWERYMKRFGMVPVMDQDDIRHHLLSGCGEGPVKKGRREGQVVWSYVVEVSSTFSYNIDQTWLIWNKSQGPCDIRDHGLRFLLYSPLSNSAGRHKVQHARRRLFVLLRQRRGFQT